MKGLSQRQTEILNYIQQFISKNSYSPSVRDIAKHFNLASAAGVHKHIKALVGKGALLKEDHRSRSVRPTHMKSGSSASPEFVTVPLAGYVSAGQPIESIQQNQDMLTIPASLTGHRRIDYALQVKGNSMIEDSILDGDFVMIQTRETADNGEVAVALLGGGEVTLKRIYMEKDHIRLQPANREMEPIIIRHEDVRVQGIVIGIWRGY